MIAEKIENNETWIGPLPKNWEVVRIKDVFRHFGSGTTPKSSNEEYYEDGTINWLNTTDLNNGYVEHTKNKISKSALKENSLKIYPVNSLAIAMYGQGKTRGTVGLLRIPATTNQAACIMHKSFIANEKYVLWWFISKYEDIRAINTGATQPNMNQDFVKFLLLQLPPISEQAAIAEFLDRQTKIIDKKISGLQSKINYYRDLIKSLINETVLKGLNKNVSFKQSRVEWMGEIPMHWEIKRIGELFSERSEKVSDKEYPPLSVSMKGVVPQLLGTAKTKNGDDRKKVLKNDFVINSRSDRRGASGLSDFRGSVSVINIVLKISKKISGKYYHHLFRSHAFTEEFFRNGKGIVDDLWATKFSSMKAIEICAPPLDEQQIIADYLSEKIDLIEAIIINLNEQIEKMAEFRKTLINNAVTGKLKVTN